MITKQKTFRDYGIELPDVFSGNRAATCPKCSQDRKKKRNKCLSVNGDKGVWHCFNCGWRGRLETEREYTPKRTERKRPARLSLPERRELPPPPPLRAERTMTAPIAPNLDRRIVGWFARRGIGRETLEACKVYSTRHYLHGVGAEVECVAFPYYRDGKLVNVKYRDGNKNMAQERDPVPCLWNIDAVTPETTDVYITEGEIDALTLRECGITAALSVDKGAPQPDDENADRKLECLTRCMDKLANVKRFYLVTDKDLPGARLEKELLARIGAEKCLVVSYPDGCKDINDVLMKYGRGAVVKALADAKPAEVAGLTAVADFNVALDEFWIKGKPRGLSTGWPELDQIFTVQPGSVNVITGVPTSGKSEFLNALMVNLMHNHNWHVAVYSPEMMPPQNLLANFAEKITGKSFFGRSEARMTREEKNSAMEYLNRHLHLMIPEADEMPDIDWILRIAKACIARYDCKAFVIDPYNELEARRDEWITENEYVSRFMSKLRNFVRKTNTTIWLVAHPTKLKKDPRTGLYPVPTLYDVCGSSNFNNKADNGLSLWRNTKDGTNKVRITTVKVKNKYIGANGKAVDFVWDRASGRFAPYVEPPKYTAEDDDYGRWR